MLAVLGRSQGLYGRSSYDFGAPVDGLGPLSGPMLAILGRSRGLCGRCWAVLDAMLAVLDRSFSYVRDPGPPSGLCWRSWAVLGPLFGATLTVLGRSCDLCLRSWTLCWLPWAFLCRNISKNMTGLNMGSFLERERDLWPLGAVLGRSWGICGRSWPLLVCMLAVLRCSWSLSSRYWAALGLLLAVLGRLGPLLGLSWRSWGGPWAEEDGPGPPGVCLKLPLSFNLNRARSRK